MNNPFFPLVLILIVLLGHFRPVARELLGKFTAVADFGRRYDSRSRGRHRLVEHHTDFS